MENEKLFARLRDLRDIQLAIQELESDKSRQNKRYQQGVRMLWREYHKVDAEIEDPGSSFDGMAAMDTRSQELRQLIADPVYRNIPERAPKEA